MHSNYFVNTHKSLKTGDVCEVTNNGEMVKQGTHQQLKGFFHKLSMRQFKGITI
jgi:hypothetical protein